MQGKKGIWFDMQTAAGAGAAGLGHGTANKGFSTVTSPESHVNVQGASRMKSLRFLCSVRGLQNGSALLEPKYPVVHLAVNDRLPTFLSFIHVTCSVLHHAA